MAVPPPGDEVPHEPLRLARHPQAPSAAVLLLHGGRANSTAPSRAWHAAGVRMRPFARALTVALSGSGVAVGHVRYRLRGWNQQAADPLQDTRDALDRLEERYGGGLPVVLVGHSMGGRAALRIGGHPKVVGVVALAPWAPAHDPVEQLGGRAVVIVHGDRDRVTDPALSWDLARRAREAGSRVARLVVQGGDHAMLTRSRDWHAVAVAAVSGMLGASPYPPLLDAAFRGEGGGEGLAVPLPAGAREELLSRADQV